MGVQGSGKSTVGRLLAERIGVEFLDGDDLHPAANKAKMAGGEPLTDEDRVPWLKAIGASLASAREDGRTIVVACSALKRWYRELLRASDDELAFLCLDGDAALVAERLSHRDHEFMPPTLLASQFATLEPLAAWEVGITLPVTLAPAELVERAVAELAAR
ncbi:gluconokinase [Schumannella soli]|uniref:Gluconokinase n=2 Tax=Schumannella soli TaxID=2590779 RepID=A0A506XYD4_9MICO|nr:gluconokinase [Schumannella soli]